MKYLTIQEFFKNELSFCDLVELYRCFERLDKSNDGVFTTQDSALIGHFSSLLWENFNEIANKNVNVFRKYVEAELLIRSLDKLSSINDLSSL